MDEEEIGRSGRGRPQRGGRGGGGGGMSLPVKAALASGLVALVGTILLMLATKAGQPDSQRSMDEAGWAAVQALSSTDPDAWTGGGGSSDAIAHARRIFADLFGNKGRNWWDERVQFVERAFDEDMDPDVKDELKLAKKEYFDAEKKWQEGGGSDKTAKRAEAALKRMASGSRVVSNAGYVVMGAWIREADASGREGAWLATYPDKAQIAYDWANRSTRDRRAKGQVGSGDRAYDVSVYAAPLDKPRAQGAKPMRAYVALWQNTAATGGGGGGGGLGWALAILIPLLVAGIAYMIASAHTKDVRNLAREIDRLGTSGDASRQMRAQGGEAAIVARAVERMVGNLEFRSKHGDADLEEIAEKERKVAEEIHGALMSKHPPRLSNWEVETLYKPGFEIAGDHFEYFPIDENHLGVILLDTNVRGLPAALVMASARSYVRASAPGETSPAAVLRNVNKLLAGDLPPGRHVTALYVVIDVREGKATMASAGHLPLIVYRHASGKCAKVNPEGIALGLDAGPAFDRSLQEGDIPIGVGDRIVLYTDGALNIADEDGEEFGEARFYDVVGREAPKNSQAFINFVGGTIDQFHLNTPQNDDITISTVKRLR